MTFNADTWWLVGVIVTVLIAAITFLIKTAVFSRVDKCEKKMEQCVLRNEHEKDIEECSEDIKQIRQDYTPRDLHAKDVDECRADIKKIKAEYATKEELKDLRKEIKADLQQLMNDVSDLKKDSLNREDFFRAQMSNEQNFQRIYDLFMKDRGGKRDGQ